MKVVKITWIDSCSSDSSWTMAEDANTGIIQIETYGVVIKETDEFISIAQNYGSEPEQFCNIMTIPKGCIKETITIPNMVVKEKNNSDEEKQGKEDVLWCINQAKKHAKDENEMGTCWFAEKWLEKQGEHDNWAEELNNKIKELHKQCLAKIQEYNTPTIIWHSIDEKPKEMKELFCEWESDDATWHDVAFYDEESHTFRHAKMPINVTKWVYVDELLEKQGEQILANSAQNCKDEQKPADKVEPRFKVKYAGSEYNVFEVKDIAGVTFYGIEDEPNHIDYVRAENCERVDGYSIKENGSPFPIKPAKFSKENPAWSEGDSFRTGTLISVIKSGGSIRPELRDEFVNWLKSLRPQNHWKSSEEQIKVIESLRHKWLLGDSAEAKYKVEAFDELIEILKE